MVNRKRAPWWDRGTEPPAATISRKSKSVLGQRLSSSSSVGSSKETPSTPTGEQMKQDSNGDDKLLSNTSTTYTHSSSEATEQPSKVIRENSVNKCTDKDVSFIEGGASTSVQSPGYAVSDDLTPTRDENPIWEVIDNTNDEVNADDSTENVLHNESFGSCDPMELGDLIVTSQSGDVDIDDIYDPADSSPSSAPLLQATTSEDIGTDRISPLFVEVTSPIPQSKSSQSVSPQLKPRSDIKKRLGSVESNRSTATLSSEPSSVSSSSPKRRTSDHKHKSRHSSKTKSSKDGRKRSRSKSRERKDEPRKVRKLNVCYDELRAKNGTALPERTYDPLNPWGVTKYGPKKFDNATSERWGKTHDSKDSIPSNKEVSKHSSSNSIKNTKDSYNTSTKYRSSSSSDSTVKVRPRSSSTSMSPTRSSNKKGRDSTDIKSPHNSATSKYSSKDTSNETSGNKSFSNSKSTTESSRFTRARSIFSVHKKKSGTKKIDKKVEVPRSMNGGDGIGIQKIRANQRKTFLSTCVEEYYLEPNGTLADGLKPLLAFKVGNPQFVSEFYEKKTELQNLPMKESKAVTRLMKEKFVFKVKLGIEKLDKFVTDGITVNGQNAFFSQFRTPKKYFIPPLKNAVLLYRYADACLGWTKLKYLPKTTPIVLLIHKVIYGRTKTFTYLTDSQYLKKTHHCDCLKMALSDEQHYGDDKLRSSISCSKVIIADFDLDGKHRERPRQILPYAFVVYARKELTQEEEADMKQSVLEWKQHFEMQRWNIVQRQVIMQQQQAQQLAMQSVMMQIPPEPVPNVHQWHPSEMRHPHQSEMRRTHQSEIRHSHQQVAVDTEGISQVISSLRSASAEQRQIEPPPLPPPQLWPPPPAALTRSQHSEATVPEASAKPVEGKGVENPYQNVVEEMEQQVSSTQQQTSDIPVVSRPVIETREFGVQVKPQSTIISLQKKRVSLTASTQTPDIDKEDSYEAMLLRGGPLVQKQPTLCANCKRDVNSTPTQKSGKQLISKLVLNKDVKPRKTSLLSQRFKVASGETEDILHDEDEIALTLTNAENVAHLRPAVSAGKGSEKATAMLNLLCYPEPYQQLPRA